MTHLSCFLSHIVFLHGYGVCWEILFEIFFLILCYVIESGFIAGLYMYMHM